MKLKPVNDKVVVRPVKKKEDEITESGIILPDSTTTKTKTTIGYLVDKLDNPLSKNFN